MKNNKGFTLVELLAVILAIAVPGISNMTKSAKNRHSKTMLN